MSFAMLSVENPLFILYFICLYVTLQLLNTNPCYLYMWYRIYMYNTISYQPQSGLFLFKVVDIVHKLYAEKSKKNEELYNAIGFSWEKLIAKTFCIHIFCDYHCDILTLYTPQFRVALTKYLWCLFTLMETCTPGERCVGHNTGDILQHISNKIFWIEYTWAYSVSRGPFCQQGPPLSPAYLSNCIHYKSWDGITYQSSNFNGATFEVWEWISNFTHTLLGMWLLIHARDKVNPYS